MHMGNNETEVGNQGNGEPLAPVVHMINFKSRRVLMCRGEKAQADAVARGFKRVTVAHFVKFVDGSKKGFRSKGKKK